MTRFEKIRQLYYHPRTHRMAMFGATLLVATFIFSDPVHAAGSASGASGASGNKIDLLAQTIAGWAQKVGGVIAFFGGLQTAMGFKNDDPEAKNKGLKTIASGGLVAAVATGYASWID